MSKQEITVAHSPDSDDAFMFYALARNQVPSERFTFRHHLADIETLNRQAMEGVWDVTAISIHAFPYVADRYALLPCGGSVGEAYGPVVVSKTVFSADQLRGKRIAVPGTLTTAFLVMKIYEPEFEAVEMPFDKIEEAVKDGSVEAGLLIHEGQLTFEQEGLHCALDLGRWWNEQWGMPLPLGGNAIRKEFPEPMREEITAMLRASIRYALDHRQKAMAYALNFSRGLDAPLADRFVGMYVNDYTLDFGSQGRKAVEMLLRLGYEKGIITRRPPAEIFGSPSGNDEGKPDI